MTQVLALMVLIFIGFSIVFLINIIITTLKLSKSKEINNSENPLEKDYQFIKGLY